MSPVVGVVLLVGIVLLLAVAVAAMVLGLVGTPEPAPSVVLDAEPADDGVGILLYHAAGDDLDERTRLEGVLESDAIAADAPVGSGERIYVIPVDDEIDVRWEGPNADHLLATLDDFDLGVDDAVGDAIDDVVDGDVDAVGCEWIEAEKDGGGQIEIENRVVTCDFEADETVVLKGDSLVVGGIDADEVDVKDGNVIVGDVTSDDAVTLEDEAVADGEIEGEITVKADAAVYGDLRPEVDLEVGERALVDGAIEARRGVTLKEDVLVTGDLDVEDELVLDGSNVTAEGSIDAGGDVTVKAEGEVGGDVSSEGTVVLKDDVTIDGDVSAAQIDCDGTESTIAGRDCEAYAED